MKEVVIVSGARTAVGTFGGALKTVPAVDLGSIAMRDVFRRAGIRPVKDAAMAAVEPDRLRGKGPIGLEKDACDWDDSAAPLAIDEVIMGNVLQAGQGQNPARQAMIRAGIPKETPAVTINKVCGSGLKAIAMGVASIMSGQAEVVLAGGQENMSRVPLALPKARWG
ncbi:MAG: acetyl-CoA C-acyltransferase, partial [Deltaproteobacteria bacterium]